jgi:hypothetical protein
MKATELRIGNLVYDNLGGTLKIKGISLESDLSHIKPIPLTEEWLLKFGFIKENFHYVIDKDKYHTFSILIGIISFPFIKSNDKVISENFSFYGIKYVHQLQNLYFALTGKELILNV